MADGPYGSMSHRQLEAEHERRIARTKLERRDQEAGSVMVQLWRTGGNYKDKFLGLVHEGDIDEIIRRYNG